MIEYPQVYQNGRPRDILGPDGQPLRKTGFALEHIDLFTSKVNASSKTYSYRWDEAIKDNPQNALAMRRDCFLMAILRERQMACAQLRWHLEPEDPKDALQDEIAKRLTKIVKSIPRLQRILMNLLEAIWYGRYGVQVVWARAPIGGQPVLTVVNSMPINGDKIQFRWDGTPVCLMYPSSSDEFPPENILFTDRGRALILTPGYFRQRFIIHKHEVDDADYFEGEMAGSVHGIGVRSRIYWMNWIRLELQSWVLDFSERFGQGLTIFYYEEGNPASQNAAKKAAEQYSRNTVVLWPRSIQGKELAAGVERVEVGIAGSAFLIELQRYFDEKIERFIIGQSLSSKAESTGLGSSVADLHADTKSKIIAFDAGNLEETLTQDLVKPLFDWNFPRGLPFACPRWVFDVDRPDAKDQLEAAKSIHDMGIDLDANEVRGIAGLSKPEEGAELVEGQEAPENPFGGGPPEEGGTPKPGDKPPNGQQPSQPKPANGVEKNQRKQIRQLARNVRLLRDMLETPERYVRDASGHEHAPAGSPEGGQFGKGGHATGEPKKADSHAQEILAKASKVSKAAVNRVSRFIVNKYQSLEKDFGRKGAIAILAATVALTPVPLPGTSLAPIAIAKAYLYLRKRHARS